MIRLENISKYYYSETSVTQALRKINLEFHQGEFVAITGESGSGKSTLLNVISGLDTFDDGEMYFEGNPTFQYDESDWEEYRRNRIGFVFQNYSLIGHYTVKDNVISALLIQGISQEEAASQAMGYIEKVGLKKYVNQRASELSSGQKQRLSIARALAKQTDILVADEPTGNLDSETGNAIIQVLKEISKEKLVIMVTHNYDQVQPYITRKVRLHDGELVTDVVVENGQELAGPVSAGQETEIVKPEEEIAGKKPVSKEEKKIYRQNTAFFALHNIGTQKSRALLFFLFFFIVASVSFVFIGELYVNSDDRKTKKYDNTAYFHQADNRLSVRRPDGKELTSADMKKMESAKCVTQADQYDVVNDINYYIVKGKDYNVVYGDKNASGEEEKGIELGNKNKFMMSSTAIKKEDLLSGRLPEKRNEIVLYSSNKNTLNKQMLCYFTADNLWGEGEQYFHKMKVVGLLKESTSQVYFAPELCRMFMESITENSFKLKYFYDMRYGFQREADFIPVIADKLEEGSDICPSINYAATGAKGITAGSLQQVNQSSFPGPAQLIAKVTINGKKQKKTMDLQVGSTLNTYTGSFFEIDEKLFWQLYPDNSRQASVYITNYAKTDKAIKSLNNLGYEAVSTFRVSATSYVQEKVAQRLVLIGISVLVLIVLLLLEVLILRSIMKIRIKEFYVMKFMGMRHRQMNLISYIEMGVYCVAAMAGVLLVMVILSLCRISAIGEMFIYFGATGIPVFLVYNLLLMTLTVDAFNRLLKKRI